MDIEQPRLSLGTAAARNLATTTESVPQMQGITSRWLLEVLPWVQASGGAYRVNRRLGCAVGDGRLTFTNVGADVSVIPQELCELPLLRGFDDVEALTALSGRFRRHEYQPGDVIVEAGRPQQQVFLIAHGKANKIGRGEYGDQTVLDVLANGQYFGEQVLAVSGRRRAHPRTGVEPMTDLDVTPARRSARDVLNWSRAVVDPALRAAVDRLPGSMRAIAGYHFRWWDEHGHPTGADPGKAVRPAFTLPAARAVGGTAATALPAAVAVELVHNFSLLHDDVMDGDTTRRHRPAAWAVFGVNAAISAGDALLTLALDVLASSGHPAAARAIRVLSDATQRLNDGQAADLAFEKRGDVPVGECVRMAENKTAALVGAACAVGALFGDARPEQVERLRSFGELVGLAFRFTDDLLGIWGDPDATGKPVYSDLDNRKKSLPVVAAPASGTPAARELDALYHVDRHLTGDELVRAAELIEVSGAREWSRGRAEDLLAQSRVHLRAAHPDEHVERELAAPAGLSTRRDH